MNAGGRRAAKAEQLGVEERAAHLEPVRHAHPVGLDEQVVEQVGAQVEVEQAVERAGARGRVPDRAVVVGGPVVAAPVEQRIALWVLDRADPGAVGVGKPLLGDPGKPLQPAGPPPQGPRRQQPDGAPLRCAGPAPAAPRSGALRARQQSAHSRRTPRRRRLPRARP